MINKAPFNDGLYGGKDGVITSSAWRKWFNDLANYILTATGVFSVSGTAPVQVTAGTTLVVSMPPATDGQSGYLTSSDHISFSSKVPAARLINGHNLSADVTLAVDSTDFTLANNSVNDVTITKHGFAPIAPNDTAKFLRGDATWANLPAAAGYQLSGITILTPGSGTYTKPAGVNALWGRFQAGGGGGGGCAGVSWGAGGSGGGGGYAELWIASPLASYAYTVGQSANGGAAGNNPGTPGNNTTFGAGPIITCTGGGAGPGDGGGHGAGVGITIPGLGGAATGGDINIPGGSSFGSFTLDTPISFTGGNSVMGFGGSQSYGTMDGHDGTGYGSGGSGGVTSVAVAHAGGKGAAGKIVIWEYK